jgi:hypothetical protein
MQVHKRLANTLTAQPRSKMGLFRTSLRLFNMKEVAESPTCPLEVDHDIALGLGTTYQYIPVGWRLDWVRPIANGAGDQRGLAIVTDACAAGPSHGDIAGFG